MKKKVIVAAVSILCITSAVFAAGLATGSIDLPGRTEDSSDLTDFSAEAAAVRASENYLANSVSKSADMFDSIMDCCNEARSANVSAYVSFMSAHSFSPEQLSVINDVLSKGTTIQSLVQAYDFWLTTDEPFSVIGRICELEDTFLNEFWCEDAFNRITGNKHGVITIDEIRAYRKDGVSDDEILAANALSRKGVYDISEILDKVRDGKSIDSFISEIYGVKSLPEDVGAYQKTKILCKAEEYGISKQVLSVSGEKLSETVSAVEDAYSAAIFEKTESELSRLGISPVYDDEGYEQKLETAVENGMIMQSIKILTAKGYTMDEIVKASELGGDDFFAAAKQAREALKND